MEVWSFRIIIEGLELRQRFVVLIYACLVLFFVGYKLREDLLLKGRICNIKGAYMFRLSALMALQDGYTHPSVSVSSVRDLCSVGFWIC